MIAAIGISDAGNLVIRVNCQTGPDPIGRNDGSRYTIAVTFNGNLVFELIGDGGQTIFPIMPNSKTDMPVSRSTVFL
jgi:hypothetical protein